MHRYETKFILKKLEEVGLLNMILQHQIHVVLSMLRTLMCL
uniref:Uncharacterized protein n=1 Tax=Arundo donax TaxID=35708 RepID=A0A0A9GW81_ARUDO